MDQLAIQFKKVSKSFGTEKILDEFDLAIGKGEFVAVVGPSGCGKSTVLRMIAGLESIDSGNLSVGAGSKSPNEIGFVFQESNLLPWLNTFDNVALPFRITHQTVDCDKVNHVLNLVGLPVDAQKKYPKQLSGGMKMRASIARSLVLDPETLLLDEPFAALDDLLRTALNLELMEIWERDKLTTLFVTHNIAEAIFVSQKILVLNRGNHQPKEVVVPFDYPRDKRIRTTGEFAELYAKVSSLLEAEAVPSETGGES